MSTENTTAPGVKPAPKLVAFRGNIYRADHRPAPFTDKEGVYHADFHDGLVAIVYSPQHLGVMAAAPDMMEALRLLDGVWLDPKSPIPGEGDRIRSVVNAAIAKATQAEKEGA